MFRRIALFALLTTALARLASAQGELAAAFASPAFRPARSTLVVVANRATRQINLATDEHG
jgi:hypothetical protein